MIEFLVVRDVTIEECDWLQATIKKGSIVYKFYGATYGCIGPDWIAITLREDGKNPFLELPYSALKELPIR